MTTHASPDPARTTIWAVVLAVSVAHMLNDTAQSLLSALYPVLHDEFALSFAQIGFLGLAFQVTASALQPVVGFVTDRRPMPYAMAFGMGSSLAGILMLAFGQSYGALLAGSVALGMGSAVFHPEASRVARLASGGRFGAAQSFFQVGGNLGHAAGPLMAAFIVIPLGRPALGLFSLMALAGVILLARVGAWHAREMRAQVRARSGPPAAARIGRPRLVLVLGVLAILVFSKNIYTAGISSYFTFFVIDRFALSTQGAQLMLFVFLVASVLGVAAGGMIGDRIGVLWVIWISILGVLPFTLMLPHADLFWTGVLAAIIGFVISSAFPAIVVLAQELVPGRVGLIAGLFFGMAFGIGGIAAGVLGLVADARGIRFVFEICAWLPAFGLLAILLPRRRELLALG
jgi:FSR family fosmidomycin resistance protein-like MFS transporter